MQTAYLPLQSLGKVDTRKLGGLCQWWYVPKQFIDVFGEIDPLTQSLLSPPTLVAGASWFGPVDVPDKDRGWKQKLERAKAGPYWKQSVSGVITGNEMNNHINRQNLAYNEVVIVGLLRAGPFFIVIGNEESGLTYDEETDSGDGAFETHKNKFGFAGEGEALVLAHFNGITSTPPPAAPGSIYYPTPADHVAAYTYTADGSEGDTLTIPALAGKTILLFARENVIMDVVTSGVATARKVLQTGTDFQFVPDLQPDEFIKIIYKS